MQALELEVLRTFREEELIPICDKWKVRFRSGMGTWIFVHIGTDEIIHDPDKRWPWQAWPESVDYEEVLDWLPEGWLQDFQRIDLLLSSPVLGGKMWEASIDYGDVR